MSPEQCKYTEDHEWVFLNNNEATIGVSQHAVNELGDIVFVELPESETSINQKDEFGSIESVKTVSSLYAPISGTVTTTNESLENTPELVNESPYQDGWLIKITISDEKELDDLMTHDEYQTFLETL